MTNQIKSDKTEIVQFHNQSSIVLNYLNKPYVAIKPICENIGLDWKAQSKELKEMRYLIQLPL